MNKDLWKKRALAFELAAKLDGVAYGSEVSREIKQYAKENGLVIIYGSSDDLMEIEGAIEDEADVYGGRVVRITKDGVLTAPDCGHDSCLYYKAALELITAIKAVWCGKDSVFAWTYETDVPHGTFRVFEDGEPYCMGIVFAVDDLKF